MRKNTKKIGIVILACLVVGGLSFASALQTKGITTNPEYSFSDKKKVWYLSLPKFFFKKKLKGEPEVIDGQTLHPKMQYLFEMSRSPEYNAYYGKMLRSAEGREKYRRLADTHWPSRTMVTREMKRVEDRVVQTVNGPLKIRIYTPKTSKKGPLPVITYFHGGAYIFGSIDAVDRYARVIANEADAIVVSSNYRLAPEHPHPAAQEDGIEIFKWVVENVSTFDGDPKRIAVGGDSAGAAISLAISLNAIEKSLRKPDFQLLYYPVVNILGTGKYQSEELFKFGYGLDPWMVDTASEFLFPNGIDPDDLSVRPLEHSAFGGLPPSYVGTAGFDILRDHGRSLVELMEASGVPVTYEHYPSLAHNYLEHSGTIDDAKMAAISSARILGEHFWK